MKTTRVLLATALASTSLLTAGVSSASAADSCGSGFHKQEDGVISGSRTATQNGRSMTGKVSGMVRWCTRDKTLRDQFFQRVIVGVPSGVTYRGSFSGSNRIQICETASFSAHIAGGSSADISIGTDGVSATITKPTSKTKTVTLPKKCLNGSAAQNTSAIQDTMYNFSATAPNDGAFGITCPHIDSVTVSVTTSMTYRYNGENRTFTQKASNTDVPNNYPTIGC
ncbi:MAG: hypothetical protein ABIS35_02020 [Terracoccus sp.]